MDKKYQEEIDRLHAAIADVSSAVRWCRRHSAKLEMSANYHLWTIHHGARRADWWPLRGKMVLDGKMRRARHAPDWAEVSAVLMALWALKEPIDRKRDAVVAGGDTATANSSSEIAP